MIFASELNHPHVIHHLDSIHVNKRQHSSKKFETRIPNKNFCRFVVRSTESFVEHFVEKRIFGKIEEKFDRFEDWHSLSGFFCPDWSCRVEIEKNRQEIFGESRNLGSVFFVWCALQHKLAKRGLVKKIFYFCTVGGHSKTGPLEIGTEWWPFCSDYQCFGFGMVGTIVIALTHNSKTKPLEIGPSEHKSMLVSWQLNALVVTNLKIPRT